MWLLGLFTGSCRSFASQTWRLHLIGLIVIGGANWVAEKAFIGNVYPSLPFKTNSTSSAFTFPFFFVLNRDVSSTNSCLALRWSCLAACASMHVLFAPLSRYTLIVTDSSVSGLTAWAGTLPLQCGHHLIPVGQAFLPLPHRLR